MKKAIFVFSTVIMFTVILICIYIQDKNAITSVSFTIKANNNTTQSVKLYYDNGKYYAFLPSYADFSTMVVRYDSGFLYLDDKYYNADSSFSEAVLDRAYSLEIKNVFGIAVCNSSLIFMKGDKTSSLFISLTDGTIDEINKDKNISKTGFATIINSDQSVDFSGSFKELHGRGNSSWQQAKKSYTLEFSKGVNLLGMGTGKGWVLLSNSFDESGLRNKLAYDTAKDIGVKYAVDSEYVDLYIDNVYYGLYLLAERIEIGENRVNVNNLSETTQELNKAPLSSYSQFEDNDKNKIKRGFSIPNNPDDITGGYLLQIEHHVDRIEQKESLVQTEDLSFSISSPKYSSKDQIDYINTYINDVEGKIKRNDFSYIDIDSFIKYYLIQEIYANNDNCSYYLCKDSDLIDNKLYACSIWDFDLSIGNSWLVSDMNPRFLYCNKDNWYNYLTENSQFMDLLRQYYMEIVKPNLDNYIYNRLNDYKKMINKSFLMDKKRWNYSYNTNTWADNSQNRFDNLDEHIDYITNFMEQRIDFLDKIWIRDEDYFCVSFSTSENTNFKKYYSVKKGDLFNEDPTPESEETKDYQFLGWFDSNGNKYTPNRIITQNESYTAKWISFSTQDETPLSLTERIKLRFTGGNKYLTVGLGIIILAIIAFVTIDVKKKLKSRRHHNDK